jgi:hypothetical protein
MNAARIRALSVVGVLMIGASVLVFVTMHKDTQTHASYLGSCPAGSIPVVVDPLPNTDQINLKVYNGSNVPGAAENLASAFSHRGFKVANVGKHDNKPAFAGVAQLYYGPSAVGAAWVVRAYFLMTNPDPNDPGRFDMRNMHFNLKRTNNVVDVVLGKDFRQLGARTEVNQAIAALGRPAAPPGTCAETK